MTGGEALGARIREALDEVVHVVARAMSGRQL